LVVSVEVGDRESLVQAEDVLVSGIRDDHMYSTAGKGVRELCEPLLSFPGKEVAVVSDEAVILMTEDVWGIEIDYVAGPSGVCNV